MTDLEFEIDGKPLSARPGQMVIEVADAAGIYIPRFCYHKHLSIAANCRMCLVEVEKVPKALPACATPVAAGMKVFTRSPAALMAQKAVMEFLLVNHPLDCPICDQGGECELQDLSMGFGGDTSFFSEGKRAVADEDLGPLVATEMTRCIQCTRCVRFGSEVAGLRELGAVDRGENMKIRAGIRHTLQSEISGNIIDLCPVGALTSRPFRFQARAWELKQLPSIAPHDCVGSHINVHTRTGEVMRVVPHENPAINETWLSDRDRFSYEGLKHPDRLLKPMVRFPGHHWQETDWQTALDRAARSLRALIDSKGADQLGALVSPSATLEECFLLQKICRALGTPHIDHRLRETDFRDQDDMPAFPGMATPIAALEEHDVILLVGSCLSAEQPLLATRVRKAVNRGAKVIMINMVDHDSHFPVLMKRIVSPEDFPFALAGIVIALQAGQASPVGGMVAREFDNEVAGLLRVGRNIGIYAGAGVFHHPEAASIRALLRQIAAACHTRAGWLTEGANAAGAWIAGAIPHRGPCGNALSQPGLNAAELWRKPRAGYLLCQVEPDMDCALAGLAAEALRQADVTVSLSAFAHPLLLETATVILPVTPFTETAGTFVNVTGEWQGFSGVAQPLGDARPGWKVLRVLGNLLDVADCNYASAAEVASELQAMVGKSVRQIPAGMKKTVDLTLRPSEVEEGRLRRVGVVPIYRGDALTRRAEALQKVQQALEGFFAGVTLHPFTAAMLQVSAGDRVLVRQGEGKAVLTVRVHESVPKLSALIPAALPETAGLGELFGVVEIERV